MENQINLGFTGTREGMSPQQLGALGQWLGVYLPDIAEFHHGDCIGADMQAHDIVDALKRSRFSGIAIHSHPGNIKPMQAMSKADVVYQPKPPLERNRDIVAASDRMFAAPLNESGRGGTWMTIRWAQSHGTHITIILPDGSHLK